MPYDILVTPEFERDFRDLPKEMARRIGAEIDELAANPELMRFPLKGMPEHLRGLHKYRVGDYRVIFRPEHESGRIIFYAVAHRRDIYRRLRSD